MAILFVGAELEDFTLTGGVTSNAGATLYRSAYARQAVDVGPGNFNAGIATAAFTASSTVNVTARFHVATTFSAGNIGFVLSSGGTSNARIRLKTVSSAATSTLLIEKYDGASATTLATSVLTIAASTLYKLDVLVSYGTSGRVRVYIDGVLFCDSGTVDVTAGGSTTLNQAHFASFRNTSVGNSWSEVIITDSEDTRPLSVKTLVPDAAGDVTGWTAGAYTDIDDVAAADIDLAVSDTAAQVLSVNCTGMPSGASNLSVRAVKSVVLAARGATGPSKIDIGLRQSSTNAFAASQTLDTGYATYSATWTTNPITSATFTSSEINSLQLAYRSAT